jgi:acyl-CoA synthetase (NDP forming)
MRKNLGFTFSVPPDSPAGDVRDKFSQWRCKAAMSSDSIDSGSELLAQMHAIFHPRSVAIVGVPRGMKVGKLFLIALLDQKFPGAIFPVHPEASEIDGLRAYPRVSAIPEPVDLVIVLVPHHQALPVIEDCAAKGVKGVVLFTAGYKETGTPEGKALEEEIVRTARAAGMRLIGPNCMGIYAPESGLSFFPQLPREPGPVGLISQSGSLTNILGRQATQFGIRFSKVVSLGNECDLTSGDFLLYLGKDPKTRFIGAYLEGIVEGPRFLRILRETAMEKPVVLWKVGLTLAGSRAASSHTGSLASSPEIWSGMVKQGGGIPVDGFEAWIDAMMGFSLLPSDLGDRLSIISGPGGLAVAAAEASGRWGLRLAELSSGTLNTLAKFVPPTGTSLRNPVDVGMSASMDVDIYIEAARAVAADPGVDAIAMIGVGMSPEANQKYTGALIEIREKTGKAFLMINVPGFDPTLSRTFCEAGVPCFESAERALSTYNRILQYNRWKSGWIRQLRSRES